MTNIILIIIFFSLLIFVLFLNGKIRDIETKLSKAQGDIWKLNNNYNQLKKNTDKLKK